MIQGEEVGVYAKRESLDIPDTRGDHMDCTRELRMAVYWAAQPLCAQSPRPSYCANVNASLTTQKYTLKFKLGYFCKIS